MFEDGDAYTTTGIACETARLNYRYRAMFEPVKELFRGSTVLDLGCHNGRWSYVSLRLGASRVVGIDSDPKMVKLGTRLLHEKGIPSTSFSFSRANVEKVEIGALASGVSIVLCMGLLYYLADPLGLLATIADLRPALCIVDTFHSRKNVPERRELDSFLRSRFFAEGLACYDDGSRVSYHCRPQIKLL